MHDKAERLRIDLSEALRLGAVDAAQSLARQALAEGVEPVDLIQGVLVPTLAEVGQRFQEFKVFLPELMAAGQAAKSVTAILEEAIAASGKDVPSLGKVVLGTVANDQHDIGKNILGTLLTSHGFTVIDLGRDVSPSAFLDAARREQAAIVAMSCLMTTTRPATRSTISLFREVGARDEYKLIVGGGCIDQAWASEIGADGYAPDAASGVELCKALLGAGGNG